MDLIYEYIFFRFLTIYNSPENRSFLLFDSLIKLKAFWDAIVGIRRIWNDRRDIQKARKATTSQFGSDMTWSIGKLIFRATDSRPIPSALILKDGSASGQAGNTDGS